MNIHYLSGMKESGWINENLISGESTKILVFHVYRGYFWSKLTLVYN